MANQVTPIVVPLRVSDLTKPGDMAVLNRWAEQVQLAVTNNHTLTSFVNTATKTFIANPTGNVSELWEVPQGGTGDATLPPNSVLLGEGTNPIGAASPVTAGYLLTDNGPGVDPSFQAAAGDVDYYQTVQRSASSTTQRPKLNFSSDFTVADDGGNTSTDIGIT